MGTKPIIQTVISALILASLLLTACSAPASTSPPELAAEAPEWFGIEMTDVQSGETFTMNDFAGEVVLVETMAMWCPNCTVQANEVRELHKLLENPDDLISVSLDVDVNEDAATLKEYAEGYGFEWHFAIAPLEVARALGNLYTAQYLNPPLSPMLIIDRDGGVHHLEYGQKSAETLLDNVKPYLDP
jgi:cytochrome oxidase Cu insertion factor (SCO1/SenC/PrrC family)